MVIQKFSLIACFLLSGSVVHAQEYLISTIAGGAPPATPSNGASIPIGKPNGVATDASGNLYFTSLNCVFKLSTAGTLTVVAGNSRSGYAGDGGPATAAQLNNPWGVAFDRAGNLYISDTGNSRIRRVSPTGLITSVAGNGTQGFSGDGGPAARAQFNVPEGIAVDAAGNLYIADAGNSLVREVATSGLISTFAGKGGPGYYGDGLPATSAQLSNPQALAFDTSGNLYIADSANDVIRMVSTRGTISTVAGNGYNNFAEGGFAGDGGPATKAELNGPTGIAVDASGNLYIADYYNYRIREVSGSSGIITTIAGTGTPGYAGDSGPATSAQISSPSSIAVDSGGNLYFADRANGRVRRIASGGTMSTVAGNGISGYAGDGGPALNAQLDAPSSITVGGTNIYIADTGNNRIRMISSAGTISTLAGNGTAGYAGDGAAATTAELNFPQAVAVDAAGNVYISDAGNRRVRKVSTGGVITTVAGNGSSAYAGDGGQATGASLNYPAGLAFDAAGNLYIADAGNNVIRKVSTTGVISTVAGTGMLGYSGDGGSPTSAQLNYPYGVALDPAGNLYIADTGNSVIRQVSAAGVISTVAGMGLSPGYSGDGGPALAAQLDNPYSVVVDSKGDVFIADTGNGVIRELTPSGNIVTVAGGGGSYPGDGGPATSAQLTGLAGLAVDAAGDLYTTDSFYSVREMKPAGNLSILIGAVIDAASESALPVSPGKIVVIYGVGLGPSALALNQPANGAFGTTAGGTTVSFNSTPATVIYASATQVSAIVPYEIAGSTSTQVTVSYQGQVSAPLTIPVATSAPSFFSSDGTGAGQIAAVNTDGSLNNAAHPVKIGGYVSLYATGEGQTNPAGVDGQLAATQPYPQPALPVHVTVGGVPATFTYAGAAPTEVAGLMQIVVQIPAGVQPGGYVPVVLQVGTASTVNGATWIAVSAN